MQRFLMVILLGGVAWAQTPAAPDSPTPAPPAQDSSAPSPAATKPVGQAPAAPAVSATKPAEVPLKDNRAADLLPEMPPPPKGKPTLMGGTIRTMDRVRDQLVVQIFGGKDTKALFDERTHIYRDGEKGSSRDLRAGEHVYLDTVLDGSKIFARNIYVVTKAGGGESQGQVVRYDQGKGELLLRDRLSSSVVKLRVASNTLVLDGDRSVTVSELRPGSLVSVDFRADGNGQSTARKVSILAKPGSSFVFVGKVTHLDLHGGLLVLSDPRDHKTYEVNFNPSVVQPGSDLKEGADVTVTTGFDGTRYTAKEIAVNGGKE